MTAKLIAGCLTACLLTAQLPGCSFTASVESMLSPPRLTVEQEQIYQALQQSIGSQISLKYPKSGERLSAFIVDDLDGDGSDEAVVFYEFGRDALNENRLRISLFDQKEGEWTAVDHIPAAGAEIDRVDIERLGRNPRQNLIIRYSMVDGFEHAVQVLHYENGALAENLKKPYSVMALRDLDGDGTTEVLIAAAAKDSEPATAFVYEMDENGDYPEMPPSRRLSDTMTDVTRIAYGNLPTGKGQETIPAIYMDGITGATTVQTVVLKYSDETLSLLYADSPERYPKTERSGGALTMDIDGDGEAEIPVRFAFYDQSTLPEAVAPKMTNWYVCRNKLLMREYSSYYSAQDGFVFLLPKRWEGSVTARQENDETVFWTFEQPDTKAWTESEDSAHPEAVLLEPLLRLAVVSDPVAADAMQSDGYLLLQQKNSRYYLGKIGDVSRSMRLTPSELLVSMRFLQ